MATKPDTTAPARPASTARIIDLNEARRVALPRYGKDQSKGPINEREARDLYRAAVYAWDE